MDQNFINGLRWIALLIFVFSISDMLYRTVLVCGYFIIFALPWIQATLGSGKSSKKTIVQCNVGDKKPIYLCSLLPEKLENCALNLEFEEDE